jgi:hypothetical protein
VPSQAYPFFSLKTALAFCKFGPVARLTCETNIMPDTFQILAKFLERFSDEVQGRELQEPTEEIKAKLQRLARGALPKAEKTDLFAQLNRNPEWIAWLAREVKGLRGRGAGA